MHVCCRATCNRERTARLEPWVTFEKLLFPKDAVSNLSSTEMNEH